MKFLDEEYLENRELLNSPNTILAIMIMTVPPVIIKELRTILASLFFLCYFITLVYTILYMLSKKSNLTYTKTHRFIPIKKP
ncbi:MAG TPA: hypothetical protein VFI70_11205 [Nitrososphaeraceae archaeon]|nr:hypothetical protein [Nitrososphaeraceae archaeon]